VFFSKKKIIAVTAGHDCGFLIRGLDFAFTELAHFVTRLVDGVG
jgi:hypothetical protein